MLEKKEYTTEAAALCWKRRNTQQRPWRNARREGIHNRGHSVMLEEKEYATRGRGVMLEEKEYTTEAAA